MGVGSVEVGNPHSVSRNGDNQPAKSMYYGLGGFSLVYISILAKKKRSFYLPTTGFLAMDRRMRQS
ncbi:MAG: hypothetical protein HY454_01180 [Parcubacteria group bacterium]|nr:hypothetical protein [Parcubacteria group bacterium]